MSYEPQDTDLVESETQGFVVTTQADLLQIFDLIKTTSRVEGAIDSAIQSVPEAQRALIKATLKPMIEDMGASVLDLQKLFVSQLPSIDDVVAMYGGHDGENVNVGATSAYVPQVVADDVTSDTSNGITSTVDEQEVHGAEVGDLDSLLDDKLGADPVYDTEVDDHTDEVDDMNALLDGTLDSNTVPVESSTADSDDYLDELNNQQGGNTVMASDDEFLAELEGTDDTVIADDMVLEKVSRTELPVQNSMSSYNELVTNADISAKHHLPDLTVPIDDDTLDEPVTDDGSEADNDDDMEASDVADSDYGVETDEFGEPLDTDSNIDDVTVEDDYEDAEFDEPTEDDYEDAEFDEPTEDDYDNVVDRDNTTTDDTTTEESPQLGFSVPQSNN